MGSADDDALALGAGLSMSWLETFDTPTSGISSRFAHATAAHDATTHAKSSSAARRARVIASRSVIASPSEEDAALEDRRPLASAEDLRVLVAGIGEVG